MANYGIAQVAWCLLCLFPAPLIGQLEISGRLSNARTGEPAAYVQVVLYKYQSDEILAYQLADSTGAFMLKVPAAEGVFTLATRSLSFEDIEKQLVIADRRQSSIKVDLSLEPKTHDLKGAEVVSKRPPIIVKEDTIIYDVAHWADSFDQTLEGVLKKIPGFEVLEDGELKVKGKQIHKVLINGEEINDGGAALLTRALSPERVASVEVRFKEQNERLKESLLSQDDLVTLDIKLKKDFDQSLFGRLTGTLGHQSAVEWGGKVNLFSLNQKVKLQLLGERDAFGDQSIFLHQIKNLGAEAFAQIFEIPADFNRLQERPGFNQELYGFREYTGNVLASVGLNGRVKLLPSLDLFFGSYNYANELSQFNRFTQAPLLLSADGVQIAQRSLAEMAHSKNKLELTFDQAGWKARYNFNWVLSKQLDHQNQEVANGDRYDFSKEAVQDEQYHNLFVERRLSEQSGLQLNLLYSKNERELLNALEYESLAYRHFFVGTGAAADYLEQLVPEEQTKLVGNLFFQFASQVGTFKAGLRYLQEQLLGKKELLTPENGQAPHDGIWSADWQKRSFVQWLPYLSYQASWRQLQLSSRLGYAFNGFDQFSPGQAGRAHQELLDWQARASYEINDDNDIQLSYSRSVAHLPLHALLPAWELTGFQTISIPGQFEMRPQPEQSVELSARTFALSAYGIALETAGIWGSTFNSPVLRFNEFGLIEQYFNQLPTRYAVAVGKIGKVFDGIPLQLKLEPSIIYYLRSNLDANGLEAAVRSTVKTLDFSAFSAFKQKSYDFEARWKYSAFGFAADGDAAIGGQRLLSAFLTYHQKFWQQKIQLSTTARYSSIEGGGSASLLLWDAALRYRQKKAEFSFIAHNLFNADQFLLQEITPVFFIDTRRAVFGRYFKIGATLNIN